MKDLLEQLKHLPAILRELSKALGNPVAVLAAIALSTVAVILAILWMIACTVIDERREASRNHELTLPSHVDTERTLPGSAPPGR